MPDPKLEANKQTVLAFDEAGLDHRDSHGASTLPGERHVEHDPLIADGADGFTVFVGTAIVKIPNLRAEVENVFGEGDFVMPGSATVGPFQLEGGDLVVHRDVIQPIQDDAANQNGMF
jgi:predicted SnoaL-like aldol condensation-catalyzing enzyme